MSQIGPARDRANEARLREAATRTDAKRRAVMETSSPDGTILERTDRLPGGTVRRLRVNSKYTQKEGWHPADITVEFTGPADEPLENTFEVETVVLHEEASRACNEMNRKEGR